MSAHLGSVAVFTALLAGAAQEPAPPRATAAEIARADLEADVRFLAADRMRGRMTASPEGEEAARYLARRLERAGLAPGGDEGSFLQRVALERVISEGLPELVLVHADASTSAAEPGLDFDADLAMPSTGILRVVPVFAATGEVLRPDREQALVLAGSSGEVRAWLERAGSPQGEGWGLVVRLGSEHPREERRVRPPSSRPRRPSSAEREGRWLRAHKPLFDLLMTGRVHMLELKTHARREPVVAYNAVGLLAGRGADGLAEEAIVVSAHYDHIGVRGEGEGEGGTDAAAPDGPVEDQVYNGADDNASGTAAVLELAEAFAAGPAPARTLVFLLATGEELGLLGTEAYLDRPAISLERTVFNLNLEMIGRPDPLVGGRGRLWMVGWDLTSVGPALAERGLKIAPDPRPEERFFLRSDNIAFVRRGVVGQSLSSYSLHADYHQPSDEADTLDYEHLEACTREAYRALRLVADGALRPAWVGEPPLRPRDGPR